MGRELKRKQAKREGKNVKEVQKKSEYKELTPKTFGIIIAFLLLFFVILYLLTGLFITKEIKWFKNNDNNMKEESNTISNKILAMDSLRQSEEEYYVYFYDTTKEDSEVGSLVSKLEGKVYKVDLHDDFNKNFVGEASGIVGNINELKVTDPTVIKVSSEKITEFYSGSEEIKTALK